MRNDLDGARRYADTTATIASRLLHFLENHDEPRAAALFTPAQQAEFAAYIDFLPGPCLWHDGQFEGYRKKLPVHICRGPDEPTDEEIFTLYRQLLCK